jgi:hypothetical protein
MKGSEGLVKMVCYTCGLTTLETGYCCFSYMQFVLIFAVVVLYCFVMCVCVCVFFGKSILYSD